MPKPTTFQTSTGASAAALALACEASPTGRAKYAPFTGQNILSAVVRPVEGGHGFVVLPAMEGWEVRELSAEEVEARIASGKIQAAEDLIRRAHAAEARARELLGSSFSARHTREASVLRERADALLQSDAPESRVA
jgi:hypothetical protein